jgi:hypothetical protein
MITLAFILLFGYWCFDSAVGIAILSAFKIHFAIFGFAQELQEEGCC